MSPLELERYLHQHIPLSKAMHVRVLACDNESVLLAAPLEPNINHRDTAFGGSASALAILSAWSLVHVRLTEAGIASRVVIQRNTMEYRRPIKGEFTARASMNDGQTWAKFVQALVRRGKARIRVGSVVECGGEIGGEFSGDFVALGAEALRT